MAETDSRISNINASATRIQSNRIVRKSNAITNRITLYILSSSQIVLLLGLGSSKDILGGKVRLVLFCLKFQLLFKNRWKNFYNSLFYTLFIPLRVRGTRRSNLTFFISWTAIRTLISSISCLFCSWLMTTYVFHKRQSIDLLFSYVWAIFNISSCV